MRQAVLIAAVLTLLLAGLALGLSPVLEGPQGSPQPDPAVRQLGNATVGLHRALDAAAAGDFETAKSLLADFESIWEGVEARVAETSPEYYQAIEQKIADVRQKLAQPASAADLAASIESLDESIDLYLTQAVARSGGGTRASAARLESLLEKIVAAEGDLSQGNPAVALAKVREAQAAWPFVEAQVKARSPDAYRLVEGELVAAVAALAQPVPDTQRAFESLEKIRNGLRPLTGWGAEYGVFDAAVILLREGLEAVLVITALLAFLRKTGHADKAPWVWGGGLAGAAASVGVGLLAGLALSGIAAVTDPELIEGVTALVAAALLVYVSYWLHSKSSLQAWQQYIQGSTSRALARGSLFGLGLIAFLAVFREGAETVIFYLGIAPGISTLDLLGGLALGGAVLGAVSVGVFLLGVRLPLRPFFLVASLLIYLLAFKFIGTGIHSLQVAGLLGVSLLDYLPAIDWLGIFPTWETLLAQAALLLAAAVVLVMERRPQLRRA